MTESYEEGLKAGVEGISVATAWFRSKLWPSPREFLAGWQEATKRERR